MQGNEDGAAQGIDHSGARIHGWAFVALAGENYAQALPLQCHADGAGEIEDDFTLDDPCRASRARVRSSMGWIDHNHGQGDSGL